MIKRLMSVLLLNLIVTSCCVFGEENDAIDVQRSAWGLQGSIATNGNVASGITHYGPGHSAGLLAGAKISGQGSDNTTYSFIAFGGGRHLIQPHTYFAYGVDVSTNFGRSNGQTLKDSYFIAPYVSLEHYLATHVLLSIFMNPYAYSTEKVGGVTSDTHRIFSAGGLALNYLF